MQVSQRVVSRYIAILGSEFASILTWTYRQFLYRPCRYLRQRLLANFPFVPPSTKIVDSSSEPDYFIFGVIDWHFRFQRPQQLAKALSTSGRRVFYVSSNFCGDCRAGFDLEALDNQGRLFQVKLYCDRPPVIYFNGPTQSQIRQLRAGLGELLLFARCARVISLVQHPFWLDVARVIPNSKMVYDCIDHHEGFGNNSQVVLALEKQMLSEADSVITTSAWLDNYVGDKVKRKLVVRNACDFEHFSNMPSVVYREKRSRKIIGYFGAIASWLDIDLVRKIAESCPDCCVLMVGADTVGVQRVLADLDNVEFVGEVSYQALPYYLHAFDVAILPFKIYPLTLATNPVKVYEYLSAGKPVVTVDLPEMAFFEGCVDVASDPDHFIRLVRSQLQGIDRLSRTAERQIFASRQTWSARCSDLIRFVEVYDKPPKVSIVIVTFNNLDLTKDCLGSIDRFTDYCNFEIVVVDNASEDGTVEFLDYWVGEKPGRVLKKNRTNKGFAAGNNIGIELASGDYFVLLNNDTYVTPGWLGGLLQHLIKNDSIGLVGPVTNNIGNEAKIDICYESMPEMITKASRFTYRHFGDLLPITTLAFFCVMFSRKTFELVGPLDESFGLGFFEDDDYCRRVEKAGLSIVCAQDVFVHHHLSASFKKMDRDDRRKLFAENRARYEEKWGVWKPHRIIKRK